MTSFIKYWTVKKNTDDDDEYDTVNDTVTDPSIDDTESDKSISINDYIFGSPLYSEVIFENMIHEKYHLSASKLINNIDQWEYNRQIDDEHVQVLKNALKNMKNPHFFGSIKIAYINQDKIKLLDGGHRCAAICEMIKENKSFDIQLDVDIYKVDNVNEEDFDLDLLDLFVKMNSNKQIKSDELPENKIVEVMNMMINKWSKNIKIDDTKDAYKPNITKRLLYQKLKTITSDISLKNKTSKEIFANICIINDKISKMSLYKLFGRNSVSQRKLSAYEKAKKYDFYLNLDCQYDVETWISLISKTCSI